MNLNIPFHLKKFVVIVVLLSPSQDIYDDAVPMNIGENPQILTVHLFKRAPMSP